MTDSRDEHPILRTIVYLTLFHLFLFFSLLVPLQKFVERLGYKKISDIFLGVPTIIIAGIVIPLWLYYYLVKKNNLEKIVNEYAGNKLNKNISVLILFFSTFLFLFVGPTITIFLFGGSIMTHDYAGILTPYLPAK